MKYEKRTFDNTWETLAVASVDDVQKLGINGLLEMFEKYHKHTLNEKQREIAKTMLQEYVNK